MSTTRAIEQLTELATTFHKVGLWAYETRVRDALALLSDPTDAADFQNFHRLLCERFGYRHDPIDWRRDQASLMEHIAVRLAAAGAETTAPECAVCFESEAFTGTCGGGQANPRALCYQGAAPAAQTEAPQGRTAWPAGMLQDDSRGLSKALASKPDAPMHAREAAAAIQPDVPAVPVPPPVLTEMEVFSICSDVRQNHGSGLSYAVRGTPHRNQARQAVVRGAVVIAWTKITDEMPKSGRTVLVVCETSYGTRRLINRAMWVAAKTEESNPESEIGVYDEETDTYYDPEGWYERISHWDDFSAIGMSGVTVTHWMPLPEFPKATP